MSDLGWYNIDISTVPSLPVMAGVDWRAIFPLQDTPRKPDLVTITILLSTSPGAAQGGRQRVQELYLLVRAARSDVDQLLVLAAVQGNLLQAFLRHQLRLV